MSWRFYSGLVADSATFIYYNIYKVKKNNLNTGVICSNNLKVRESIKY